MNGAKFPRGMRVRKGENWEEEKGNELMALPIFRDQPTCKSWKIFAIQCSGKAKISNILSSYLPKFLMPLKSDFSRNISCCMTPGFHEQPGGAGHQVCFPPSPSLTCKNPKLVRKQ